MLSDAGAEVEAGTNSTALVTLLGHAPHWDHLRGPLGTLLELGDKILRKNADREIPEDKRLTNTRLNRLEGVKGSVRLTLRDVPEVGEVVLDAVFNGDEASASPLAVSVSLADLLQCAEKGEKVKTLVKSGRIKIGGDMGLSVKLMAAVA